MNTHPKKTHAPIDPAAESPQRMLRRCGRTFHFAALLLPPETRSDLAKLYAFCRTADDIADETHDHEAARKKLDAIDLAIATQNHSEHAASHFLHVASKHRIPHQLAHQLIVGVRNDIGPVRIHTEQQLLRYAYRVASTVGIMISHVLRVPAPGFRFAIDLGVAMQLTNIARDIAEDAHADRVYIPAAWLEHRTVLDAAINNHPVATQQTRLATLWLLDLAHTYYRSADRGMHFLPRAARPGIIAASRNYEAIGNAVRNLAELALTRRATTSATRKAIGTLAALAAAARTEIRTHNATTHDNTLHAPIEPLLAAPHA